MSPPWPHFIHRHHWLPLGRHRGGQRRAGHVLRGKTPDGDAGQLGHPRNDDDRLRRVSHWPSNNRAAIRTARPFRQSDRRGCTACRRRHSLHKNQTLTKNENSVRKRVRHHDVANPMRRLNLPEGVDAALWVRTSISVRLTFSRDIIREKSFELLVVIHSFHSGRKHHRLLEFERWLIIVAVDIVCCHASEERRTLDCFQV